MRSQLYCLGAADQCLLPARAIATLPLAARFMMHWLPLTAIHRQVMARTASALLAMLSWISRSALCMPARVPHACTAHSACRNVRLTHAAHHAAMHACMHLAHAPCIPPCAHACTLYPCMHAPCMCTRAHLSPHMRTPCITHHRPCRVAALLHTATCRHAGV